MAGMALELAQGGNCRGRLKTCPTTIPNQSMSNVGQVSNLPTFLPNQTMSNVGQVSNLLTVLPNQTMSNVGQVSNPSAKVFAITLRHRSSFCSLKNCSFHLKA